MDSANNETTASLLLPCHKIRKTNPDPAMVGYGLPHEVIVTILHRLPLKSLFRFKAVCKLWEATITDPKFTQIFLRQSKSSTKFLGDLNENRVRDYFEANPPRLSRRPVRPELADSSQFDRTSLRRVAVKNDEFVPLSIVHYAPKGYIASGVLCDCDGLFLILPDDPPAKKKCTYALWNPSTSTHRELRFPLAPGRMRNRRLSKFGIFYDRLSEDYKVVIGDEIHYAVYSCGSDRWSKIKGYTDDASYARDTDFYPGVSFNGSIYWVSSSKLAKGDRFFQRYRMCCYDGRDETFKNVPNFDFKADSHSLISSDSGLFFFPLVMPLSKRSEMVIIENDGDGDAWKEMTVQFPKPSNRTMPLFWTEENKIMFRNFHKSKYKLYDHCQGSFTKIRNNFGVISCLLPYTENLLML